MGRQRRIAGCFETCNQAGPPWFDQHIAQSSPHQHRITTMATTEYQREVRTLCHEFTQRVAALQHLARTACSSTACGCTSRLCQAAGTGIGSRRSAVHSAKPPSSNGPTLSPWRPPLATASPSSATDTAPRATAVHPAARWRQPAQQRMTLPNRPCRNRTECPCRSPPRNRSPGPGLRAVTSAQRRRCSRLPPAAARRHCRESPRCAPAARRCGARSRYRQHRNGVTENIEAHRYVGHRGRRERTCDHRRAPSPAATRSRSANTPAAVTSGPAPGPCTTNGLSQ